MNKMRAVALRYAEFGWPVFPVHTPTGNGARPCSCRRITRPQLGEHPCHKFCERGLSAYSRQRNFASASL